jgi:hypothetical protein
VRRIITEVTEALNLCGSIEWRNPLDRADCPTRPFCTTVLTMSTTPDEHHVPTTVSSTLGTHDDASSCTAPRGGDCWLMDMRCPAVRHGCLTL